MSVAASTRLVGRVVTAEVDLPCAEVIVRDGRILSVAPVDEVAERIILPGLVDVHCHGGGGASFTSASADQARAAAGHHREQGTTTLVASTVTDSPERMLAVVEVLADLAETGAIAGIHLEGPFLSRTHCGAQDPAHLREPDPALAARLVDAGRGHVRVMTVAPELPGADELADLLRSRGVVTALGHSAAAADVARAFLQRPGCDLVTHLCNGMPPLHHRSPGPVAASLAAAAAGDARLELVADGVHLDDEMVRMVFSLVGPGRIALVTDAMAAAGMADGDYELGPQRVRVRDGVARLAGSEAIAGGTGRLLDVVRRLVALGIDPVGVVRAATLSPAGALGLDVPMLREGERADLVLTDLDWRSPRVVHSPRQ